MKLLKEVESFFCGIVLLDQPNTHGVNVAIFKEYNTQQEKEMSKRNVYLWMSFTVGWEGGGGTGECHRTKKHETSQHSRCIFSTDLFSVIFGLDFTLMWSFIDFSPFKAKKLLYFEVRKMGELTATIERKKYFSVSRKGKRSTQKLK